MRQFQHVATIAPTPAIPSCRRRQWISAPALGLIRAFCPNMLEPVRSVFDIAGRSIDQSVLAMAVCKDRARHRSICRIVRRPARPFHPRLGRAPGTFRLSGFERVPRHRSPALSLLGVLGNLARGRELPRSRASRGRVRRCRRTDSRETPPGAKSIGPSTRLRLRVRTGGQIRSRWRQRILSRTMSRLQPWVAGGGQSEWPMMGKRAFCDMGNRLAAAGTAAASRLLL